MHYILKRNPRASRVTLRIDEWGDIVVSAPLKFPEARIPQLLAQAEEWIVRHQRKRERHQERFPELGDRGDLLLLGTPHRVLLGGDSGVSVDLEQRMIRVAPVQPTLESAEKAIIRHVRGLAERELITACSFWSARMGQTFESISLRDQRSRWGSCSSEGSLNFNWKLAHAPKEVLEYVVIHELAHRKHMDHSRSFWALVARHDGRYEEHRGWLRTHGDRVQRNIREAAERLFVEQS